MSTNKQEISTPDDEKVVIEIEGNPHEVDTFDDKGDPKPAEAKAGLAIEVQDDTPPEDRGKQPMPKEIVQELEQDELEEYSDKVKLRMKQMKKVWHDERRAKEAAEREREEAVKATRKLMEENNKYRQRLTTGEKVLLDQTKAAVDQEMEVAKRNYREAYESGDGDKVLEAQQALNAAQYKSERVKNYEASLQNPDNEVEQQEESPKRAAPEPDERTKAWQKRNKWFGSDSAMTGFAMGYHQDLVNQKGADFVTKDEYWTAIDAKMREVFPNSFKDDSSSDHVFDGIDVDVNADETVGGGGKPTEKPDTKPPAVVAPVTRTRASNRVTLTRSQIALTRKLGITPEQYAAEFMKLEQ